MRMGAAVYFEIDFTLDYLCNLMSKSLGRLYRDISPFIDQCFAI
jgi:hypothetical protein